MHTDPIMISSPEDLEQTVISSEIAIQKNYLVTAVELPSSISSSDSETESDNHSSYSTKDLFESIHEEDSRGTEAESTWKSLASTVLDSNRICHDDVNSPYCLPADNYEKTRLDMQHTFIRDHICNSRLVLDDKLILKDGDLVLDLGTGSGAWASEMARRVPKGVKIQGLDISDRLFPADHDNVTYTVGSILSLPAYLLCQVTLAHQRLLIYALRRKEWSQAIDSIKNALIPGEGVVQLTEVMTPTDNPGAAQEKFQVMLSSIARKRDLMLNCGEQLPALLEKAGFTEINTRAEKVRLGSAGGVVGLQAAACRIGAFRGMRDSVLADGGYGVVSSREAFDALLDSIQSEWEINECYATYYMITARRPASSFTAPPLSLSIPEIFDFHARYNGHLSFFRYAGETGLHQISYSAVNHAIECAAGFIKSIAGESDFPVAVLAISDSITFITMMLGFLRAGVKAFFISPRNSASAISHLLQKTGSRSILVSNDESMQQLAEAAITQDKLEVTIRQMPTYDQLFNPSETVTFPLSKSYDLESVALILHSSGSTNFPKPIQLTHRNLIEWGRGSYGERNFEGEVLGGHSLAFFHAMGVIAPLWCAYSGMQLAVFPPASPPFRPTPENVYNGIVASRSTYVFCVPSHIERWAAMPETYTYLSERIKALAYCGAPLGADAGNLFSSKGVNLQPYFASTETGGMSMFLPERPSETHNRGWARFRIAPHCNVRIVPRPDDSIDEELLEIVFLKGPDHTPSVFNTEFEGEPAYTTGDLVVSIMDDGIEYFRFYGREDDQILLSTGEKTNPVPIEKILLKDDNIDFVVLFGEGKQQNGALVQPSASYLAAVTELNLSTNDERLIHFRQAIAPSLAAANEFSPAHSFLFPELVLLADSPFQLTGKGTVRRRHTLNSFSTLIETAYTEVERSTLPEILGPESWTINNTLDFVSAVIHKVLGHTVPPNEDIFQHGADSLSATWIRNTILRVLRGAGFKTRRIPADFVFQFPSTSQLAAFLFGLHLGAGPTSRSEGQNPEKHQEDDEEEEEVVEEEEDPTSTTAQTLFSPPPLTPQKTLVKLRPGPNPLILLPTIDGSINSFPPLQERFRSALWALQLTPSTPLSSMAALLSFYRTAIKAEQPSGPYRFGAYSAASIFAVALARAFEDGGDVVVQVALLDHAPRVWACPVYRVERGMMADAGRLREFKRVACEGMADLIRRDGSGRIARRHEMARGLVDAFEGRPGVAETMVGFWRAIEKMLDLSMEFMLGEEVGGGDGDGDARPMAAYFEWERGLKAPVSVYIAEDGIVKSLPGEHREEWADLGSARSWPTARIHHIPVGHLEMLTDDKLIDLLQNEWK